MSISKRLSLFFLVLAFSVITSSCGPATPRENGTVLSDLKSSEASRTTGITPDSALYVLHIIPRKAYKGSTLSLIAEGFSLADARIVWKINGVPVPGQAAVRYKAEEVKRGDTVQATAVMHAQEIVSNGVTIANSVPEFNKIRIMPESFKPGDTFSVEAFASDADGDNVIVSYEWILNGATVSNDKAIGVPVKRGDQMTIKLIASDGRESSLPAVLKREISNFPPIILEDTTFQCVSRICLGQIVASDPDGDRLTYTLKQGPEQVTLDPVSGLVKWEVPAAFWGKETISVAVSDGHGGESTKTFSVDVKK